jgi:hypothetical protein
LWDAGCIFCCQPRRQRAGSDVARSETDFRLFESPSAENHIHITEAQNMGRHKYKTFEIHDTEDIPSHVGLCRFDEQPSLEPGQTLIWRLGKNLAISESLARTFVRDRVKQIADWSGSPDEAPAFLKTHLPVPPRLRGRGHGRPIVRICRDGRLDCFPSVKAAANAVGCHRPIIDRRLMDGREDEFGCRWLDADAGGQPVDNPRLVKRVTKKSSQ